MRPTLSLMNSLFALTSSIQKPLIAYSDLGYDQRMLPIEMRFDQNQELPFTHESLTGEAEMDQKRSSRSNPDQYTSLADDVEVSKPHVSEPETIEQRLARIKAEIEAGVYETPEKLEIAIDRMIGAVTE